ncbi:MAG: bifunctional folylpolyglutamate synthase/dihydrofolate synthase [SAR86 cluster bacterium]|jgi:dihydrofolate synthase/folylpolyglutamate synthase|nr:bifunctional folylpolyglutamate synthase/dihydrofolate synthase [SAR86 cluster bacterium]
MKLDSLNSWLERIQSLGPKEIELGLERISPIYEKLIRPFIKSKTIVVGGTNGKGTTVEFLSQLLISKKRSVGTFTSPHLFNFNERIKVNGQAVPERYIINSFKLIEENRGSVQLTYFDFSTLAALLIFNEFKVDVMVLEIGLGGRLDPVNIVDSDIAILTNVELDHQDWLGNTREIIGKEKAAIFRSQKPVILGQHSIPESVLEKAIELQNQVYRVGGRFDYQVDGLQKKWSYSFSGQKAITFSQIHLNNLSVSSLSSALTAFCILEEDVKIDIEAVLKKTDLKGRCELIENRFLLDVSHNESSARYLSAFLERNFESDREISAVFGVMSDKDINSIIKPLLRRVKNWYATSPDIERSMDSNELSKLISLKSPSQVNQVKNVKEACLKAHEETGEGGLILIFGSFYTVAEAFPAIKLLRSVA